MLPLNLLGAIILLTYFKGFSPNLGDSNTDFRAASLLFVG